MTEREEKDGNEASPSGPDEPPVDGPGAGAKATNEHDDAGATSYDQPGGSEHGTEE